MPRTARDSFDEPDDDAFDGADDGSGLSDRDDPDPADQDDDDIGDEPGEAIPCPFCRKPVYEGADVCPHCHNFISAEDAPRRLPWWIWAGVILCLIAVVLWVF